GTDTRPEESSSCRRAGAVARDEHGIACFEGCERVAEVGGRDGPAPYLVAGGPRDGPAPEVVRGRAPVALHVTAELRDHRCLRHVGGTDALLRRDLVGGEPVQEP